MKRILFLLLFLKSILIQSQTTILGEVRDGMSHKILPFATVKVNNKIKINGGIDGKISFQNPDGNVFIDISYIGYKTQRIDLNNKLFYAISLIPDFSFTKKQSDSNEKKAKQVIQKAVVLKRQNGFLKNTKNFSFNSYNKLIVTANPDSISSEIDTIFQDKKGLKVIKKIDSTSFKFKKIVAKQHLFETEKASFFQFKNGCLKETIIGSKMAGFKQPIYEVLGFSLQSFSIYDSEYSLLNSRYKSPLAKNAIQNFNFILLDTTSIDKRKMYLVYFQNKKKNLPFDGILYIDIQNFAIAKAVMHTKGILELSGTHQFRYLESEKIWFPTSNIFKLSKGQNDKDINILGGTITFDADLDSNFKTRKKEPSDFVYLISETKNDQVTFNNVTKIQKPGIAILVTDEAPNQPLEFWDHFRRDTLESRSRQTYLFLDSISVKRRFEKKVVFGRKIINGFVPVGKMDLDLRKFINFNNYEGFRICIAGVSNEFFSRKFRLEGYTAYGTKDGEFKYNFGAAIRVGRKSSSWLGLAYTDDIQEIASTTFAVENRQFNLFDTRFFNISSFYNYVSWKGYLETRIIPKTESIWEISHNIIDPKFNYTFFANGKPYNSFNLTTIQLSLQWSPFSQYMQTPNGLLENEKRYPKFTVQINKSVPKTFKNDFDFTKLDFKTEYEKKYIDGQLTNIIFSMGYAIGDVPLTHLYNNSPNSLNNDKLLLRTTLDGDNDFETMYFNEFFSNQYAFFQFKHEFKSFTILKPIKPNLVFIFRTAIGNLTNPEQHVGITYKTLKDGYLESGAQLNKIYKGAGIGVFYRFGPNHLPNFDDNIAIRISYKLDIGL